MPSIRKTKTSSGKTAVQVVRYENRKVVIVKHLGSAKTNEEIAALIESAEVWINANDPQPALFQVKEKRTLSLASAKYIGVSHSVAHEALKATADKIGFGALHPLLLDLAYMRLIEPSSKLRSIELLKRYFGIEYAERTVYRTLPKLAEKKKEVEEIAVSWAKQGLSSDLSVVLYDVTTLYFETFESDDLRVPGFSKDNKSQQPQIVVGLLVNREGFPLGYEIFKGNTFEGKTMLPVLEEFAKAHNTSVPTVVADAAMISRENVKKLSEKGFSYIVGARLANASPKIIEKISAELGQKDGSAIRIETEHGSLVCGFSSKRYRKDKHEMDVQIVKAKALIAKGESGRRAKFVGKTSDGIYQLDEMLQKKTESLLGIKGYYTNIGENLLNNQEVISRYKDLWRVEAAFRMSKSDLAARPIFHYKADAVKAHMLICFTALVIGKYLEMTLCDSLRNIIDMIWEVTDAKIQDTASGEVVTLRSDLNADVKNILRRLGV